MATIPLTHGLLLAAMLFLLGLLGVLVRRNILFTLLCLEIMLNAAGLAFIVAGAHLRQVDGQVMYFSLLTVTAAEVSVGLALVLQMHERLKTLDIDAVRQMKG